MSVRTGRVDVGATPGADPTRGAAMHATRESHLGAWGQPRTSRDEGGALSRRRHIEDDASTITAYLYS